MIVPTSPARRLGDPDPLDSRLAAAQGESPAAGPWWGLRSRLALGMSPTPRPGLVLLTLGLGLGPAGLDVLSRGVLVSLDPLVSVALASLGVLVGLGLRLRHAGESRLFAAASLQGALTMIVVAAGVLVVDVNWLKLGASPWMLALLVSLCAAASSTHAGASDEDDSVAMRIGDLDDVLPIVVGGLALALLTSASPWGAVAVALAGGAIAAAVALAGWLLVGRADATNEQHTFVAGTLLLLGGGAAYLSLSALFAGLVAGVVWNVAGGLARDRIARDMRYLQHSLIVLLLLVAGARLDLSVNALAVAVVYLACRVIGKLVGGWLVGRLMARGAAPDLGLLLMSPGVTGIAFAVNAVQADIDASRAGIALAIVALGSLGSELLSLIVRPPESAT